MILIECAGEDAHRHYSITTFAEVNQIKFCSASRLLLCFILGVHISPYSGLQPFTSLYWVHYTQFACTMVKKLLYLLTAFLLAGVALVS